MRPRVECPVVVEVSRVINCFRQVEFLRARASRRSSNFCGPVLVAVVEFLRARAYGRSSSSCELVLHTAVVFPRSCTPYSCWSPGGLCLAQTSLTIKHICSAARGRVKYYDRRLGEISTV